jgi:hypothetical protein
MKHLNRPAPVFRRAVAGATATALAVTGALTLGIISATAAPADATASGSAATAPHGERSVVQDAAAKTVTMTGGDLRLVLSYEAGASVSSLQLGGLELLAAGGIASTAELDETGTVLDSRSLPADPRVKVRGHKVDVEFTLAADGLEIDETWSFDVGKADVDLEVDRRYDWGDGASHPLRHNGQLDIAWARVWDNVRRPQDGGNLPIGNAYTGHDGFFLSEPNDRYGVEQSQFVLLANEGQHALAVNAEARGGSAIATEFAYADGATLQETQVRGDGEEGEWGYITGTKEEGFVYSGHTSNGTDAYIYEPVTVADQQRDRVEFTFSPADYASYYELGTVNGVADPAALTSLLNDFGRSGVVDTGYGMSTVGLRYLGTGPYDLALSNPTVMGYYDPAMTASQKNVLEYFRDYAQGDDGHMYGRTYRLTNPWGDNSLADADPAYVGAIAEMYEYSPDDEWLASMRDSATASIDFMLGQRYDAPTGMFTNDITTCSGSKSLREWNDAFYVKWQSGYVNELMYNALTKWSVLERDVFGDTARADSYAAIAASLKEQFNKDAADGGLWDPEMQMFAYWRCQDGTVQASVKHTQLNLQAVAFGLVDVERAKVILDGVDEEMQKNRLSMIPQNFYPILPGTEEWSGDHFQSGLEDGPIYPFMTEMYMRAAAFVGERERSLSYLDATLARYTEDGYHGYSFLDWSLKPRFGEDWFPTNANAAGGVYRQMLGIQPTADGVTIAPNFPAAMNGSAVTKTIHADDSLTVTYHSVLDQTIRYSTKDRSQNVTLRWSGQQPGATYTVRDERRTVTATADADGVVSYTVPAKDAKKDRRVTLVDGSVDGYLLPTSVAPDLALNAAVTASSSQEFDRYSAAFVTDGARFSTDPSIGWSSDASGDVNHQEWISLDLGSAQPVARVDLLPRNYDGRDIGRGFPESFTIETSVDGVTWSPAVAETGYAQPTTFDVPSFSFEPRDARYVRVTGTSLRQVSDFDGEYRMQLAEVEVFAPAG